MMRRRQFILGMGGTFVCPLSVRAQQQELPVIGFLSARAPAPAGFLAIAFRDGLNQTGYVDGRNVAIEYRWADGHHDQLPALAADLVRRRVAAIAAISGTPAALAAKTASTSIPIVFANGGDPIATGLVSSLSRPAENVTGATFYTTALVGKRLELLRELLPQATIALLMKPNNPAMEVEAGEAEIAARELGLSLRLLRATNDREIDAAFAQVRQWPSGAVVVGSDPFFGDSSVQIVRAAARKVVPTVYFGREFAEAGGLLSYGSNQADTYRQAGVYVGRILQGAKPADLPVVLPTRFELVINLKTARSLGLAVPQTLLARADEVIE
jgi:ABC-type uncharacterized transport system substrate-binding protein